MLSAARILVVDDEKDAADMLAALLRTKGCDAAPCYSGQEALDCIAIFRPDLILLDLAMPVLSGIRVAQIIRASGHACRIVALTGIPSAIHANDRPLFDAVLIKPASERDLRRAFEGCGTPLPRPARWSGFPR